MLSVTRHRSVFQHCLDDEIRRILKDKHAMITYHSGQKRSTDKQLYERVLTRYLLELDNKWTFSEIMKGHSQVPPTYTCVSDIPPTQPDSLWFIKNRYGANGRMVRCVTYNDLQQLTMDKKDIIQQAVTDLDLIDGCKYTVRAYILFHAGSMYMYDNACVIKHAFPYDSKSTCHDIQINHKGYTREGSKVSLTPLAEHRYSHIILSNIRSFINSVSQRLKPYAQSVTEQQYVIWGIDIIVQKDLSVKLIEMNIGPNLSQNRDIREQININMINNVFRIVLGLPQRSFNRWHMVHEQS